MQIHKILDYISDFFNSLWNPIATQQEIRELRGAKQRAEDRANAFQNKLQTCSRHNRDIKAERDKYKRRYHANRDLLADAIFERLSIDKHVTDVRFGSQSQGTADGKQIETAALIHCYVDSYKFDELKMFTASGNDNVTALIKLYESLKNADIPEFTNAELK